MAGSQRACVRTESDFLGPVKVPADAGYGAQTQRAVRNFPVGAQRTLGDYPRMIEALMLIKRAAAQANRRAGFLPPAVANAIVRASRQVLARRMYDQFPVHALHGGGGTSANMNANELLANLAEEMLGGRRGEYRRVHPNDHVNLHQSTNDVYPTACHIAVIGAWPALRAALDRLADTLSRRARQSRGQKRIARTCLQDAVDVTFADLLSGYESFVRRASARIGDAVDRLHSVNLGGTVVGRTGDAPAAYRNRIIPALRAATGDAAYRRADNLFDAAQNPDDLIAVSAQLDLLARGLIKIAQDFRLMASGPEAGLGEIRLPAVQPGSSIMPGKVNPVIPEFLIQAGFQTIGCHAACAAALDHGELDLNVWESAVVFNLLDAMDLLSVAVAKFDARCVRGFKVNLKVNARHADTIIPLLARLTRRHGYSKISALCRKAGNDPARLHAMELPTPRQVR